VEFLGFALIGRNAHTLQLLWTSKPFVDWLLCQLDRHDPLIGREYSDLVQPEGIRHIEADTKLFAEDGGIGIGIVADSGMDIMHGGGLAKSSSSTLQINIATT